MRIAIVCYPTFGGSGVVATELGLELAHLGHEIHFITYQKPVRLEILNSRLHFHEVNVPDYPLFHYQPYELALSSKLVDTVKKFKIDLLHVHYAIPHAYAAYMAKQMLKDEGISIPIVTTLHGTDVTLVGRHPFYKTAVTFSINNSDCVTSVSESLKRDTLSLFQVKKEIEVIPNFVDFSKHQHHSEVCDRSSIASPSQKIIAHVSNFRKVKRIPDVIEVFHQIQKETNAILIMVGDGPERFTAKQICKEKGIYNKVKFLGKTNQVYEILCYSDLFLLPSETESFGLAALEAMMMSVPVISSNAGGLPEVNQEGISGYLFDVGDVQGMSKKAIDVLNNEAHLVNLKAGARKVALEFAIHEVVAQYLEVYKLALAKF